MGGLVVVTAVSGPATGSTAGEITPVPNPTPGPQPQPTATATPTQEPGEPSWVVRAGVANPGDLQKGYQEHRGARGIYGFSVQYNPKTPVDELARAGRFPNSQISYAPDVLLMAAARAVGYAIQLITTPGVGYHHTLSASSASGQLLTSLPADLAASLSAAFMRKLNPFPVPR